MEQILLKLFKVKWKNTANTYVAVHPWTKPEIINDMIRKKDCRCDEIVGVEEVNLPNFDNNPDHSFANFVSIFAEMRIL